MFMVDELDIVNERMPRKLNIGWYVYWDVTVTGSPSEFVPFGHNTWPVSCAEFSPAA